MSPTKPLPKTANEPGSGTGIGLTLAARTSAPKAKIAVQLAGVAVQDLNRLLKQFQATQKMMKQMGGGKLQRMLGSLAGQGGFKGMPPRF